MSGNRAVGQLPTVNTQLRPSAFLLIIHVLDVATVDSLPVPMDQDRWAFDIVRYSRLWGQPAGEKHSSNTRTLIR